jgi:poly-beta-1,6-N-acetyl-D-glucosamine synthase
MSGAEYLWSAVAFDFAHIAFYDVVAVWSALRTRRHASRRVVRAAHRRAPLVSVIIPAFNERATLETTVDSVLRSDHKNLEIIVIDDGSDDDTPRVARRLVKNPRVSYARQRRGGKSAALNLGLAMAHGEFLFQIDSDCYLHPDAISKLLAAFDDPKVDGACGRVKIHLPERNLVTRLQSIEFLMSFGAGRIASDALGITKVISGSFGMWRTSALRDVGSWDHPMGEDGDMTLKVRKKRGRLAYAPHAVCENRVRDTWKGLTKQRFRWNRNYIKNRLRKHLDIADPISFGWSNFWMFVDSMVYRVVLFVLIVIGLANMLLTAPLEAPGHLVGVALLYSAVTAVQYPLDVWLVSDERRKDMRLFPWLLLLHPYRFYQRMLQLWSFLLEFLFWHSYTSEYLPKEVAKRAVKW